jgi:RNA ligase (TIGR02306 family)
MSTFKVSVEKIVKVEQHFNADRLEVITVLDWNLVSAKGTFKVGDFCVFFPVDSFLPPEIEEKIFGKDSKIRLHKSRVKTIKIRGVISQGLAAPAVHFLDIKDIFQGNDVTKQLGVTKYDPVDLTSRSNTNTVSKKKGNENFKKYTGIENAKNYPNVFKEGEMVSVTCKLHGTNFRAGWVLTDTNSIFRKFLRFFRILPKWEFVYGSHNIQLQSKFIYSGYYDTNVYAEAVKKYNLKEKLVYGEVVYGEIVGDGVQKGYSYGCKTGERKLVLFDLMEDGEYASPDEFHHWAAQRGFETTPELYYGPFNKEKIMELKSGPSVYCPEQKVREGVVVKPVKEEKCRIGRKVLKFISEDYLLRNQDDETVAH